MRPGAAHPLLRAALELPAALYGAAVRLRNRRYDRPGAAVRAALPVISVGNLTAGGTGKTPLVAWLARRLRPAGRRPAIVSRGYGGRAGRGPLLVSTGDGPRCGPERCGDEPYLLARSLEGVIVVVGADRPAGAAAAREQGADVVILDDGFQHRRLARDLDVVLLDASDPFGGGRLLPAGLLREPVSSLRRADLVVVTRSGRGAHREAIDEALRRYNPHVPVVRADHRRDGYVDARGGSRPRPQRALAFCGIGRPQTFRDDLVADGVEIVGFRAFVDHHRYAAAELSDLRRGARELDAELVTTEKDLARLATLIESDPLHGPVALRIEAEVHEPEVLLDAVARACARST